MQTDLSWLNELTHKLPTLPETPTTLFDILGVATRETTISNVLAYFLDETQGHGLGRLFLDSLLAYVDQEGEVFASSYTVHREWKNIDILLLGADNAWAIIIENKIYHILNNPLDEYMQRVRALVKGNIVGIVLTLQPTPLPNDTATGYVNVTHFQLLEMVQRQAEGLSFPDSRQQLLYDDFIQTMKTNTRQLIDIPAANQSLDLLRQYDEQITKLLATKKHAETYLQTHIEAVFASRNFRQRARGIYESIDSSAPPLRFYMHDEIAKHNRLSIIIELYGEASAKGEALAVQLDQTQLMKDKGLEADRANEGGVYYHLARVSRQPFLPIYDLPTTLAQMLGRFFTPTGDNSSVYDFLKTNLPTHQQ